MTLDVCDELIAVSESAGATLDPADWADPRALGHRMLDDMFDYLQDIRQRPAWQPIPAEVRGEFRAALPSGPTEMDVVYREFTQLDRKSTRLNSSHRCISYAVFCLKKKKK